MGLRGPIGSARDLLHKTPVVSCPARIGETSSQVAAPASPVTKGTVGFSALLGGPGNSTCRVDPLLERLPADGILGFLKIQWAACLLDLRFAFEIGNVQFFTIPRSRGINRQPYR